MDRGVRRSGVRQVSLHFEQCRKVSVSEQEEDRDAVLLITVTGSATSSASVVSR